ncbi:GNAT superfamily N-acetyltransferase [Chryseobacterium sp. SORGH_AS 447]|uniref:GNAT family N-acetyltransferase n=1 Tax=Chryseobacterium sp. SORGH_AS_0447 TaxID=3041769 RepID=UPI00278AEC1B|nr:GNAT family N-acetyltransferase [Chryseobacterium sp. SORGH_AS_0447]MDQ1163310.1 GNAT superfamily N-acetyltransferase [Chryseobacterium sp. SORGH_AS_0447]
MVSLQFFTEEDFSGVNYALDENQLQYTSSAANALKRIADRDTGLEFPVTIFMNGIPAGFFTLDFGGDKMEFTENQNSVLLRSLSVHPEMQGKGIGRAAMIQVDDFVRKNFENCHEIVLAVNQNNISAYELYTKVGYQYEGKTRIGRTGPQYLMFKSI